jgi:AGCS family alanine or glycine:cation symporter
MGIISSVINYLDLIVEIVNTKVIFFNSIIWEYILVYLLVFVGVFFTVKTRFIQIRWFTQAATVIKNSRSKESSSNVSAFQAFCTSLAARIGTGNIAGVAVAISLGGPGAIFWMWVVAFFGMSTAMIENILAQIYKVSNGDGTYRGGPAYYIERALGCRWLGIIFSLAMILSFGIAFNAVQSNSMAMAMESYDIPSHYTGIVITLLSSILILGGLKFIAKFAEIAVPFMALAYIALAIYIIVINIQSFPDVISLIITDAFSIKNAAAGGFGAMLSPAMMHGIKRGLFSNEAGMGSAPNAAATAHSLHPVNQGLLGMIGVFVDTILVCTATGFIILVSKNFVSPELTGIALTQAAIEYQLGVWGKHLISVAIFLFAFTSIIANYYYGESSVRFLNDNKYLIYLYKLCAIVVVYVGAVSGLKSVWNLADFSMGIMAIINLVAILLLYKVASLAIKNYQQQIKLNKIPVFYKKDIPNIKGKVSNEAW